MWGPGAPGGWEGEGSRVGGTACSEDVCLPGCFRCPRAISCHAGILGTEHRKRGALEQVGMEAGSGGGSALPPPVSLSPLSFLHCLLTCSCFSPFKRKVPLALGARGGGRNSAAHPELFSSQTGVFGSPSERAPADRWRHGTRATAEGPRGSRQT